MKQEWLIPWSIALCTLAFALLLSETATVAQFGTSTTTTYLPQVPRRWAAPAFTATKTAEPAQAYARDPGALIAYTVVLQNQGTVDPGVLADIRDTLPTGFTFVQMSPGSDITANPTGATGPIVWHGPFVVPPESALTLIYQARASTQPGTYLNQATATTAIGAPPGKPAGAIVTVRTPLLLADTFDSNANQWTPFLNGEHLSDEQWFWRSRAGREGGSYNFDRFRDPDVVADDALTMYLGHGSKRWTDYRYEVWVWFDPDSESKTTVGLWFHGHYEKDEDLNQWVLGYYLNVNPGKDRVEFWQTQTEDDCLEDACDHWRLRYNFENPMMLVRQQYVMGDAWLDEWHKIAVEVRGDEHAGVHMAGYVDDELVIEFTDTAGTVIPDGTVGLTTYKAPLIRFDDVMVTALD